MLIFNVNVSWSGLAVHISVATCSLLGRCSCELLTVGILGTVYQGSVYTGRVCGGMLQNEVQTQVQDTTLDPTRRQLRAQAERNHSLSQDIVVMRRTLHSINIGGFFPADTPPHINFESRSFTRLNGHIPTASNGNSAYNSGVAALQRHALLLAAVMKRGWLLPTGRRVTAFVSD